MSPARPTPVLHGSHSPTGEARAGGPRAAANPLNPCFYQPSDVTGNGAVSQDFGSSNPGYTSTGADDFSVTAPCTVNSVTVWGQYNGAGAAGQVEVDFYDDAGGGLPGNQISATITQTFSDSNGFLTIPITPVSLLANTTYWVSVQAQNVSGSGVWFWDTAAIQRNPAVWQDPGGGFGTGCTTWTVLQTCLGLNSDFAFMLSAAGPGPCYSQTAASYPSVAVNSQNWGLPGVGKRDLAADDFSLTGYCKARSVIVPFQYLKSGAVSSFKVRIWQDTGLGYPANAPSLCSSRNAAFTTIGTTMQLSWANPVALVPGTYWVEIRAMGATTWGLWGWDTMPQTGSPAVWRNGGWWNNCTGPAWHNLQGCNPGTDADLAFTITN